MAELRGMPGCTLQWGTVPQFPSQPPLCYGETLRHLPGGHEPVKQGKGRGKPSSQGK